MSKERVYRLYMIFNVIAFVTAIILFGYLIAGLILETIRFRTSPLLAPILFSIFGGLCIGFFAIGFINRVIDKIPDQKNEHDD